MFNARSLQAHVVRRLRQGRASLAAVALGCAVCAAVGLAPAALAGNPLFDDPRFAAEVRRAEQERERRERERRSPAARERRARSRTAHRGLDRAAAIALAQRKFGAVAAAPPLGGVQHLGTRARGFVDDHTVLVDNGDEQRPGLMSSVLPLRVERDGKKLPVDLGLQRRGDVFVPETPLVPTRFGAHPGAALELSSSGLRIGLATAREPEGLLDSDRVFFTDLADDTDAWVMPTPLGAEIFWQLRSPDSPAELTLELTLPAGAEARLTRPSPPLDGSSQDGRERWVEIRRGERILAVIQPPAAFDAAGTEVDAGYELSGSRLTVRVDHRDADVEYPVLVDPPVEDLYGFGDTNFTGGWGYESNKGDHFWWDWYFDAEGWRAGLHIGQHGGHFWYGEYGGWYLWAPGQTSYIYGADMEGVHHEEPEPPETTQNFYSGLSEPGRWQSLVDQAYDFRWHYRGHCASGASWQEEWNNNWPNGPWNCPSTPVAHNKLSFGAWIRDTGWRTTQGHLMVRDSRVYMADPEAPTGVSVANLPPSDWRGDATYTSNVSASDPGLGVRNVFVERADGGGIIGRHHAGNGSCGGRYNRCPASGTWPVGYSTTSLPQGVVQLRGRAIDAIEQAAVGAAFPVRIDRTDPSRVALSGELRQLAVAGDRITKLHVEADDAYSGVRKVEMFVDGQSATWMTGSQAPTQGCATQGCGMIADLDFDPSGLSEGPHRVKVVATDGVSRTRTSEEFTVIVDRTDPSRVALSGELRERAGRGVVNGRLTKLHVEADDAHSGVRKLEMFVDGQSAAWMAGTQAPTQGCATQGCGMIADLDFDPSGLGEGPHLVKVVATDGVSRTRTSEEFTVIVDRTKPRIDSADGDLRELAVGAGVHDLTVTASDPGAPTTGAGVDRIDVFVRDETNTERNAHVGAGSRTTFSFDATATGYKQGRHTIRSRAVDGSGNVSDDDRFDVLVDRDAPVVPVPTGTLYANRNQTVVTPQTLAVTATDGTAGARSTERSGVRSIAIWVDGIEEYFDSTACDAGSCSKSANWTFDPNDYPGGRHTIEVIVDDQVGNENTQHRFSVSTPCCTRTQAAWSTLGGLPPATEVAYGDASGDGFPDLVERNDATGEVRVSRSNGESSFRPAETWGAAAFWLARDVRLADVDGDRDHDLVGRDALGAVWVAKSTGNAFEAAVAWRSSGVPARYFLADVDADGLSDLVTAEGSVGSSTESVAVAYSQDDGVWTPSESTGASVAASADVQFGDVTGDGWTDLVTVDGAAVDVAAAREAGFAAPARWATLAGTPEIRIADMDGDNLHDLLTRDPVNGELRVGHSTGATFDPLTAWGSLTGVDGLAVADLDNNGQGDALGRTLVGGVIAALGNAVVPIASENPDDFGTPSETDEDPWGDMEAELGPPPSGVSTRQAPAQDCRNLTRVTPSRSSAFARRHRLGWSDDTDFIEVPDCQNFERAVARTSEAGGRVVRFVVQWRRYMDVEDATYRNQVITAARRLEQQHGFDVFATLTGMDYDRVGNPPRPQPSHVFVANSSGQFPETHPAIQEYGQFVRQAVGELMAVGVQRFSIWNEPNLDRFLTARCQAGVTGRANSRRASVDLYRSLYRVGYDRAVEAATAAGRQSQLQVWFGELSDLPTRRIYRCDGTRYTSGNKPFNTVGYMRQVALNAGLRAHAVAWHPYQHKEHPRSKTTGNRYGIGRLQEFHAAVDDLKDKGLRRPGTGTRRASLHLTEFAYHSRAPDSREQHSERVMASWYKAALRQAFTLRRRANLMVFWQLNEAPDATVSDGVMGWNWPDRSRSLYGLVRGERGFGPRNRDGTTRRRAYCDGIRSFARNNGYRQAWELTLPTPRANEERCAT